MKTDRQGSKNNFYINNFHLGVNFDIEAISCLCIIIIIIKGSKVLFWKNSNQNKSFVCTQFKYLTVLFNPLIWLNHFYIQKFLFQTIQLA